MNILSIYLNMNILRKTNIDAEKKKAEGNTFYTNKQYKEAIECYTEAIGKDEFKKNKTFILFMKRMICWYLHNSRWLHNAHSIC